MGTADRQTAYMQALDSPAVIELRQATSTDCRGGRRRRSGLKFLGWALVAALTCLHHRRRRGAVPDNITRPRRRPPAAAGTGTAAQRLGRTGKLRRPVPVRFLKPVGANRSSGYAEFAGQRFHEGHLTMFMREVYEHRPFVPGGVLVLRARRTTSSSTSPNSPPTGRVLYATVSGGTYEGPAIGSFGGVRRGNRIYGGLQLRGLPNVEANFFRYSKNPDPTARLLAREESSRRISRSVSASIKALLLALRCSPRPSRSRLRRRQRHHHRRIRRQAAGDRRLAALRARPRQHALRDPGRNQHRQRRRPRRSVEHRPRARPVPDGELPAGDRRRRSSSPPRPTRSCRSTAKPATSTGPTRRKSTSRSRPGSAATASRSTAAWRPKTASSSSSPSTTSCRR